jgi:hypothetical protein
MELLLAILLYLGLVSTDVSYTMADLDTIATSNAETISNTYNTSSTMETVNNDYLQLAGGIEIIDKNIGN